MCFSGKYTEKEVYKKLVGNGGFNAYLNTNDMRDVDKMVDEGNKEAEEIREAFILQVAKDIRLYGMCPERQSRPDYYDRRHRL